MKTSTRDATGEESGEGESDGKEVKLLSEGVGACFREAFEECFRGLTRTVLDFRLDEADVCEEVRRSSASCRISIAEGRVFSFDGDYTACACGWKTRSMWVCCVYGGSALAIREERRCETGVADGRIA